MIHQYTIITVRTSTLTDKRTQSTLFVENSIRFPIHPLIYIFPRDRLREHLYIVPPYIYIQHTSQLSPDSATNVNYLELAPSLVIESSRSFASSTSRRVYIAVSVYERVKKKRINLQPPLFASRLLDNQEHATAAAGYTPLANDVYTASLCTLLFFFNFVLFPGKLEVQSLGSMSRARERSSIMYFVSDFIERAYKYRVGARAPREDLRPIYIYEGSRRMDCSRSGITLHGLLDFGIYHRTDT